MTKSVISLLAVVATACGDLDNGIDDTRCGQPIDTPDVTVETTEAPTLKTGAASAKLRGTAQHALGLAIRRITAAGLDATSDSFNFAAWSIDVPADVINLRVPAGATLPATVTLPIAVYDACHGETPAAMTAAKVTVAAP